MPATLLPPELRTTNTGVTLTRTKTGLYTTLHGLACPYNVMTDVGGYREMIAPGCFNASINATARALPLLLFHNNTSLDTIVGHTTKWDDRPDGLWGTWAIDSSPESQEAARKADTGLLVGLSIGFMPDPRHDDIYEDPHGQLCIVRHQGRLLEVSLTPTPAYTSAQVVVVRSQRPRHASATVAARMRPEPPSKAARNRAAALSAAGSRTTAQVKVGLLIKSWEDRGGPSYARMRALEEATNPDRRDPGITAALARYANTPHPHRRRSRAKGPTRR
ncbi:MAG: HK97 family phage prohead protease [Brooklawnia sp.]